MLTIRRGRDRGHADHGWLKSEHTFSFADYHDEAQMGFRSLRVINEDRVAPGKGFGTHSHRDMEIISYVLEGSLEHKDSLGTGAVIRPGDVQRMSAGTGVSHSEFNASTIDPVHFLQIWLVPKERGIKPSYEQKNFRDVDRVGRLRLVASPDGSEGSVTIHADAKLYTGLFESAEQTKLTLSNGRHAWVHVVRGRVRVNEQELEGGDAAALTDESEVRIDGLEPSEVLVFDLA